MVGESGEEKQMKALSQCREYKRYTSKVVIIYKEETEVTKDQLFL